MSSSDIDDLRTESFDQDRGLDDRTTREILEYMNQHDQGVPRAVAKAIPDIARAVNLIAGRMKQGGRLIYVGAGSSGRLGVLDAAECPPTFGVGYDLVIGIIAGGGEALRRAVEYIEDSQDEGVQDVAHLGITAMDSVVGISASGRTPYVIGALEEAKRRGAATIAVSNNSASKIGSLSDVAIDIDTGPEVLAGSTRLKAGTAQKLVLNMLSTTVMVQLGKVYQNLMVDMRATNGKLVRRAIRIITAACQCSDKDATRLFEDSDGDIKAAIVMGLLGLSYNEARQRLSRANGYVRKALESDPGTELK